jgi:hypothetical protein
MRRILLSCALLAVLAAPAVAAGRTSSAAAKPGYVVIRKAADDGGISGRPVVKLVVRGFVLGRISQEGQVDVVQLPSVSGQGVPQATSGASSSAIRRGNATGKQFTGSNFRFRAMGGLYSVTVRGSGVYLFAGGHGSVTLRGSSRYTRADGWYSIDGGRFRSLPAKAVTHTLGRG